MTSLIYIHTVLPGLLSGGYISWYFLGNYIEKKSGFKFGCCGLFTLFLIGTLLGPFVFVPAGLIALVRAVIDPDNEDNVHLAKL